MRGATRRALENLVQMCIEEDAKLLIVAGDLYDGGWRDYGTGLFFASQMGRLREAGTRVVILRGNHDAASQITKSLRLPENVRELGVKRPETIAMDDLGVALHGQGFATRAVTDDLAAHYPEPIAGLFNIGVLHTSLDGREGHENYAPTSVATLQAKGYDYWALGHVHKREVLGQNPWIVFPGNLQGRHAKETGPKGATVITLESGRIASVEARALDVVRWALVLVDAAQCADVGDVVDATRAALARAAEDAHGRALAARVVIEGESPAHAALQENPDGLVAEIRLAAGDVAVEAWVEKVVLSTRAAIDFAGLRQRQDAIGDLVRAIDAARADDDALSSLAAELLELKKKLPPELRDGDDALRLDDPNYVRALLNDVEQMIVPRLLRREGSP